MDVSIIIVSYNTRELTLSCLASVQRHTACLSYEIIVIDNASSDGSPEGIEQQFSSVRVCRNSENSGFAAAVNQGLALSNGEFLVLLNSDASLRDNAVHGMVSYARKNPSVGAVGCRVTNQDGSHQPTAGRFPCLWLDFSDHFLRPLTFLPARWRQNCIYPDDFQEPVLVDWSAGSCLLLRRKALQEAGGLDEQFFLGDEDIDLGYRLKKTGWQAVYFPSASVVHLGGQSKKSNPRSAYYFFLGRHRFYQKHYPYRYARFYRLLLLLSIGLRWAGAWAASGMRNQELGLAKTLYARCWRDIRQW